MRWWHQYQAQMLLRETDFIRNGLLQEIIAMRRRLELACPLSPHSDESAGAPQVADLSRLYSLLEGVCDRLHSPFMRDSMPLALQQVVRPWQTRLNLALQLPSSWSFESLEQSQLLVLLFKSLLPLLAETKHLPTQAKLAIAENNLGKSLGFEAYYALVPERSLTEQIETTLRPFCETLRLLSETNSQLQFQTDKFSLKLEWQTSAAALSPSSDLSL
ncbi:MAG: hypothetical protein ACFBSG_12030 [Leptolyngbyaceae cyanobacterium]